MSSAQQRYNLRISAMSIALNPSLCPIATFDLFGTIVGRRLTLKAIDG